MIHFNNVTRYYGTKRALNDVSFSVVKGETLGILGPNGSGKTTLINILLGLLRPNKGTVVVEDKEIWNHRTSILPKIGAVIEIPRLYPVLTGRDNLRIFSEFFNIPNSTKKIEEVLDLVGLSNVGSTVFKNYSLGMKQRLGIALSLVNNPDIFVFDEPTNGLDPEGIVTVREAIQKLSSIGKTVLLCSHLIHEVEKICTSIVILQNGSIVRSLSSSELKSRDSLFYVEVNQESWEKLNRFIEFKKDWEVVSVDKENYNFQLRISDCIPSIILKLLVSEGIEVEGFYKRHIPLEELFLESVKK